MATLSGTLYIQGSLTFQPGTSIKLNSQTIYADVDITMQPGTNLYEPGCVTAAGDVDFQPYLNIDP